MEKAEARESIKGRGAWAILMNPVLLQTCVHFLAQCARSLQSPFFPSHPLALWSALWKFWLQQERVVNRRTGEGLGKIFSSLTLDKANESLQKHRGNQ